MYAIAPRMMGGVLAVSMLTPAAVLAAEAGEEEGSKLAPYFPVTVWAIVSFLIVLYILWKKLFPPILEGLDRRAQAIRESLESAERARAGAEEMMKRHQDDLEKARHEARSIIEEGKADAVKLKDKILREARQESEEVAARARREIELAKQAALDDLHQRSVELSIDLASRLIEKSLEPSDHQKLIQERIRSFEAGPN